MFYKILDGIRVIEYGSLISAPFCTKVLGDLGAEVIKLEDPIIGDPARRMEPFEKDIPGSERSGLFQYLNMNKLGITLNVQTSTGKEIFYELIKNADIVVENNPPKKIKKLGIGYNNLKKINPRIVMTSITPFGQTGPYRDYKSNELIINHMSGVGYVSTRGSTVDQEPIKLPAHTLSFFAGLCAAAFSLGALYHQKLANRGMYIDISEHEAAIQIIPTIIHQYCYGNHISSRTDQLNRAPFHILRCKDGYIYHAFIEEHHWKRSLEAMGNPEWAQSELFKDFPTRAQYWDGLEPLMLEWTMAHTMEEIYRGHQQKGAPIGAVYTAKDIFNDEQFASRGFITEINHQVTGNLKYPGVPYSFANNRETPDPAPLLGQHNEEIFYRRLGYKKEDLVKLQEAAII